MNKKIISIGVMIIILLNISLPVLATEKETVKITTHTTLTHTQGEIKEKYKASSIVNKTSNVYKVEPSIKAPYKSGTLNEQVKIDTLNQINYFRWLAGVNDVSIYEPYMEVAEKKAVILAANNQLTHFPKKPSDMSEEFYSVGTKGTSIELLKGTPFIGLTESLSKNQSMAASIKGYTDDDHNVEPNVGHRLNILDPWSKFTFFGYAGVYGAVNTLACSNVLEDKFYAWPAPGNFPVESISSDAKWSITVPNSLYRDGQVNVILKANGKTYSSKNGDFKLYYEDNSNEGESYVVNYVAYYFDLPSELKKYLTDETNNIIEGKNVEVEIQNVLGKDGNTYTISYPVKFFTVQDYELGNVDGNDEIDAQDAVTILKHVAHNITLNSTQMLVADTTKDGKVDASDAVQILKYVAHNITEF